MLRLVVVVGFACGAGAHPTSARHAPRATAAWTTGDECLERKAEGDTCVHLSAADVAAIRLAILAHVHDAKDLPDAGLVVRLAEPPIAQWTSTAYQFTSTATADQVELSASERVDESMRAGFTCVLARADAAWTVVSLSPFAANR